MSLLTHTIPPSISLKNYARFVFCVLSLVPSISWKSWPTNWHLSWHIEDAFPSSLQLLLICPRFASAVKVSSVVLVANREKRKILSKWPKQHTQIHICRRISRWIGNCDDDASMHANLLATNKLGPKWFSGFAHTIFCCSSCWKLWLLLLSFLLPPFLLLLLLLWRLSMAVIYIIWPTRCNNFLCAGTPNIYHRLFASLASALGSYICELLLFVLFFLFSPVKSYWSAGEKSIRWALGQTNISLFSSLAKQLNQHVLSSAKCKIHWETIRNLWLLILPWYPANWPKQLLIEFFSCVRKLIWLSQNTNAHITCLS